MSEAMKPTINFCLNAGSWSGKPEAWVGTPHYPISLTIWTEWIFHKVIRGQILSRHGWNQ